MGFQQHTTEYTQNNSNILIIGAGPVGLWTAIQLKKRDANLNIKLVEKHENYQRIHPLRIKPATLSSDPEFTAILENLITEGKAKRKWDFMSGRFIEISAQFFSVPDKSL